MPTRIGAVQLHLVLCRQPHAQRLQLHLEPGGQAGGEQLRHQEQRCLQQLDPCACRAAQQPPALQQLVAAALASLFLSFSLSLSRTCPAPL